MPDLDFMTTFITGLVTAAGTGATWGGRKLWLVVKQVYEFLKKEYDCILQDRKTLSDIAKELKPNGGSSLRDLGDRLEVRQLVLEHKVLLLLQDAPEAHFETDKTGRCVAVNSAYLKLTMMSFEDVLKNDWLLGIHPDDLDRVVRGWNDAVDQARQFRMHYRFRNPKTGEGIPVTCQAVPMQNANGKIIGFMGTLHPGDDYALHTKEEIWPSNLHDKPQPNPSIFDSTSLVAGIKPDIDVALPVPD